MKFKFIIFYSIILYVFYSCGKKISRTEIQAVYNKSLIENQAIIQSALQSTYIKKSEIVDSIVTVSSVVDSIYSLSNEKCLWNNGGFLNKNAHSFIELIGKSNSYGLDTSFYNLNNLRILIDTLSKDSGNLELLAQSEWILSKTCVTLFTHIKYGFLNHDNLDSLYFQNKLDSLKESDLKVIVHSIKENKFAKGIDSLEPSFVKFKELRKALSSFLENKTITSKRVEVKSMKIDSVEAYEKGFEALVLNGYLDTTLVKLNFDKVKVLKKFQLEHGLSDDGRIGRSTAYALSRSNQDRWLSVVVSLEKMKWKPITDTKLFYVNIPSYMLRAIDENKTVKEFRVVVGKMENKTPEFSAKMTHLILNPFWHIPFSISSKEILPKLKKDSNLVKKKGYKIYDRNRKQVDASKIDWSKVSQTLFNYRISQVKSGGTALGKVKFIFTNKHSIYFHDTPSKRFFKNDIRAYSHGCVRVQNPLDLASYILSQEEGNTMSLDSVKSLTKTGIQKRYNLKKGNTVYLQYYSCEGTSDDGIVFYRDIYKKESSVKNKIKEIIADKQNKMLQ